MEYKGNTRRAKRAAGESGFEGCFQKESAARETATVALAGKVFPMFKPPHV